MSRHKRLKRSLSSSLRARRSLRNRQSRIARRVLIAEMIKMYRNDVRLIPPSWLWDEVYGQQILDPKAAFLITSG